MWQMVGPSSGSGRMGPHHRGSRVAKPQGARGLRARRSSLGPQCGDLQRQAGGFALASLGGRLREGCPQCKPRHLLGAVGGGPPLGQGLGKPAQMLGSERRVHLAVHCALSHPDLTAAVTGSSLTRDFQGSPLKHSWSAWVGRMSAATSWDSQGSWH